MSSEYMRKLTIEARYESEEAELPEAVAIGEHNQVNIIQALHILYGAIGAVLETFIRAAADVKAQGYHHTVGEEIADPYTNEAASWLGHQFLDMLKNLEEATERLEKLNVADWISDKEDK